MPTTLSEHINRAVLTRDKVAAFRAERNRIWERKTKIIKELDREDAEEWSLRRKFTHEHQLSHYKTVEEQITDWENRR